jgi:hypothetical protein
MMKLLFCSSCNDVIKLDYKPRTCKCLKVGGRYLADGLNATYWGDTAVPLGFADASLGRAILNQPKEGKGREFSAFVIPKVCPTMRKEK